MIRVFKKIAASFSFLLVFCFHIYFALLLGAKPAFAQAQDSTAPVAAVEDVDDSSSELDIKINATDGIVIKGSEKLIKKLQKLEEKLEAKIDEHELADEPKGAASIGKTLENVLVPIMIFLFSFGFAGYVVYSKQKTRREYMETIRTLAQNGQSIPPELMSTLTTNGLSGRDMFKNVNYADPGAVHGLKYLFIGFGIAGFLLLLDGGHVGAALGFLFIVIGAFHMTKSHLAQKRLENKSHMSAPVPMTAPSSTTSPTAVSTSVSATSESMAPGIAPYATSTESPTTPNL